MDINQGSGLSVILCEINIDPPQDFVDLDVTYNHMIKLHSDYNTIDKKYIDYSVQLLAHVKSIITSGGQHIQLVTPSSGSEFIYRGLFSLLKSASIEHRSLTSQSISIDKSVAPQSLATILIKEAQSLETEVRYLNGVRSKYTIEEVPLKQTSSNTSPWNGDDVFLISGGLGGLGGILADAISEDLPDSTLILIGRKELSDEKKAFLNTIQNRCKKAVYHTVSVNDTAKLKAILQQHEPITGVIHCAGQLKDGPLMKKSAQDFIDVLMPKVEGTLTLDEVTNKSPLKAFILFSSTSSVFGNYGQADYATANGFLDLFSELRNKWMAQGKRKGHTLSINWPYWSGGGMHMTEKARENLRELLGITPLSTSDGLSALNHSWGLNVDRTIILHGEQQKLRDRILRPKFSNSKHNEQLMPDNHYSKTSDTIIDNSILFKKAKQKISELLCSKLKLSKAQLDGDATFDQYGLDSVSGTDLAADLGKHFGSLSQTILFEYTTINSLAKYLAKNHSEFLFEDDEHTIDKKPNIKENHKMSSPFIEDPSKVIKSSYQAKESSSDIAIIGLSGRYPDANELNTYWHNIESGKDSINEIPDDRWAADLLYNHGSHGKWGGFIDDIESFDPILFNISPKDASLMDPQERLFYQIVWSLLEDAAYTHKSLRDSCNGQVGVYVGSMYQQYRGGDNTHAIAASLTTKSAIPNRVSHFFDFEGPSVAVDTMCSSAAMAIHLACKDIRHGECEVAIAGGVNLTVDPKKFIGLSHMQLLASHPESRSFNDGDGYLPSDGVGAVLLKPLDKAIKDGDRIRAVIKGSATTHGGHGMGYMVPSPKAQSTAIKKSLKQAKVTANNISYIEASANGSQLGDAIEWSVLNQIFQDVEPGKGPSVGAVKSNIGHPEAASSMAQLSKVILQFENKKLAPTIKIDQLNPKLDIENSPLKLQKDTTHWATPENTSRLALINSFGAGGTCVSLVLEEYDQALNDSDPVTSESKPELIILSALNQDRLLDMLLNLSGFLQERMHYRLPDISYTLQIGREALPERLAFVASTNEELLDGIRKGIETLKGQKKTDNDIYIVNSEETREQLRQLFPLEAEASFVKSLIESNDLNRLALYWAQGGSIDWSTLHKPSTKRIELPSYPFEKRKFPLPPIEGTSQLPVSETNSSIIPESNSVTPEEYITDFLKKELDLSESDIKPNRPMREYGLESIVGMALIRSINQQYSSQFEGGVLLDYPTIGSLAQYIQSHIGDNLNTTQPAASPVEPIHINKKPSVPLEYPLSEGQKGLWLIQSVSPQMSGYNIPICMRMKTPVNVDLLSKSLKILIDEQPILAASIKNTRGKLTNTFCTESTPYIEIINARSLGEDDLINELRNKSKEPIALDTGPLLKTFVYQANDSDILLIVIHHIIFDGRSLPIFLSRLLEIYTSLHMGAQIQENYPEASYFDFVQWEQAMLGSDERQKHEKYWLDQLKNHAPAMDMITDRPRPENGISKGQTIIQELSSEQSESAHKLANQMGVTPAVLFLGLYFLLLRNTSNNDDMIIGMPTMGRPESRFDNLIGFFINTIAIRANASSNQTFPDFLHNLQKTVVDGLDHSVYPFPTLVGQLDVPRTRSHTPVIQVAFEYQSEATFQWQKNSRNHSLEKLPQDIEFIDGLYQDGTFELALEITNHTDQLKLQFKYAPELFNDGTAKDLLDHYVALLDIILSNAEKDIGTLNKEAEDKIKSAQQTSIQYKTAYYPASKCIHQLISDQALKRPDSVAVQYMNSTLTYSELDERTDTLAKALIFDGLKVGDRAGVCTTRSLDMIVSLIAVMKAGGVYVPLDPDYPSDRLTYMLSDSGSKVFLTQSTLKEQVNNLVTEDISPVYLDLEWDEIKKKATSINKLPEIPSNSLAYIMYTSGSTGKPKGVMVEHRSVINLLYSMDDGPGFHEGERLLALATYSFDISVVELYLPLIKGGECYLCDSQTLRDGTLLKSEIERVKPDYVQATPMTWIMLLRAGWKNPDNVRMVTTGELLPNFLKDQFIAEGFDVWNMYGPTETTIYATCWKVIDAPVLIGAALSNYQMYILNEEGVQLTIGEPGELYIGGDGLARGYWNKPELTQDRFVNGMLENKYGRLYKTGDLVNQHADGQLEFMGRLDDQVKINGYRIELGEIETTLGNHPEIFQCTVTVERLKETPILVAHCIPESSDKGIPSASELRTYLKQTLPDYMVPARFNALTHLPQTPTGKIDRKTLTQKDKPPEKPKTDNLEVTLLSLWRSFLDNDSLQSRDSFFEHGGNSLLAQSLVHEIQQQLDLDINVGMLFANDSVQSLVASLENSQINDLLSDIDIRTEVTLDPTIIPKSTISSNQKISSILITGATGFLGTHLLSDLIEQTDAIIYCLVRADNNQSAMERLHKALSKYNLWQPEMEGRIKPLAGHLDQLEFGLGKTIFNELANTLDAIYHNGALINQSYPYALLKSANVTGTSEILKLACQGDKVSHVHHISTISVQDFSRDQINEELMVPFHNSLQGGYIQSKWVAEQLVCLAHQRGLPVTIYRPSRLVGHTDTGLMNTEDLFCRMIKGAVLLESIPNQGFYDNIIAVNDASQLIISASLEANVQGQAFHVTDKWYHSDKLNEFIRKEGFKLEMVELENWLQKIESLSSENPSHPLVPLLPMFRTQNTSADSDPLTQRPPVMKKKNTDSLNNFEQSDKTLSEMLRVYFDFFYKTDFLPVPDHSNE